MACDSPYYVEIHWQPQKVPVPCGRCPPCQKRRVSQWSFRLLQQEKISESSLFVTLTYDTRYVPISAKGFMTLDKKDFQKFMKRLRKNSNQNEKITYYACGEYGSRNYRPHYHAIIFNARSAEVERSWQLGEIHIGKVSGASIAYTLKYMNKGKIIPMHQNDDRIPEFSLMSKGMGSNFLSPSIIDYYKKDLSRAYVTNPDGHKIALPRYYKQKIYNENEQRIQAFICKKRADEAYSRDRDNYINATGSSDGFEAELESSARQRFYTHRKKGKENRKL